MSYQPRRYHCVHPVGPTCRRGFVTAAGFKKHKDTVHNNCLQSKSRAQQHVYHRPGSTTEGAHSDGDHEDTPDGAYYIKHPILDGNVFFNPI